MFFAPHCRGEATDRETAASVENKQLGNGDYFVIIASSSHSFIVDRARCKWTGRSVVEVNTESESFTVFHFSFVVKTLNLENLRCHLAV